MRGRPAIRGQCRDVPRPCPWVLCRYHLSQTAPESCALDVADHGQVEDTAELARLLEMSDGAVRALLSCALRKFRRRYAGEGGNDGGPEDQKE